MDPNVSGRMWLHFTHAEYLSGFSGRWHDVSSSHKGNSARKMDHSNSMNCRVHQNKIAQHSIICIIHCNISFRLFWKNNLSNLFIFVDPEGKSESHLVLQKRKALCVERGEWMLVYTSLLFNKNCFTTVGMQHQHLTPSKLKGQLLWWDLPSKTRVTWESSGTKTWMMGISITLVVLYINNQDTFIGIFRNNGNRENPAVRNFE